MIKPIQVAPERTRDQNSITNLSKMYRTTGMQSSAEQSTSQELFETLPADTKLNKRQIRQLEDQMLTKLESGWNSGYDANLGSFAHQKAMQAKQDREKKLELKHTMIKLKTLR